MPETHDVAVIVGSLREASLNRKTARAVMAMLPDHLAASFVEIGGLPLYNQDLETDDPPAAWTAFRERMARADAVLFFAPEYNRGLSGAMKNAIDVGSRPYGKSIWKGLAAGIVTVSPGRIGGFGANHQLRQSMVTLAAPAMPAPEAYVGGAGDLFDDDGRLKDDSTRDFLRKFVDAFVTWVERNARR